MTQFNVGDAFPGGYVVLDIKAGGMGVVYICHQPSTDQDYAIKTVRLDAGVDVELFLERFRDEVYNWISISSKSRHENIVDALLYNEDENWLFLEYVDGPGLHELCRHGPRASIRRIAGDADLHDASSALSSATAICPPSSDHASSTS